MGMFKMNNSAKKPAVWLICIVGLLMVFSTNANAANFQLLCQWGQFKPITIEFDTGSMTATRSDGGTSSTIIKINKWGVWLLLDEPNNLISAKVQMIELTEGMDNPSLGGKWSDTYISLTGNVDAIVDGRCWDQKQ